MKNDIENHDDVKLLINTFYDKVKQNEKIGHIFNYIAKVNWSKHLPVMYNFWESTLFFTGSYSGNPMSVHGHLHRLANLSAEHFNVWLKIFTSTVDELFEGERAELAKQRAASIATVMQMKLLHPQAPITVKK